MKDQDIQTMSSSSSLCAQGHHHAVLGLALLIPAKENINATAYKASCTDMRQFSKEPHTSVIVRCPLTFVHVVCMYKT